jgi:hypothetical protein
MQEDIEDMQEDTEDITEDIIEVEEDTKIATIYQELYGIPNSEHAI